MANKTSATGTSNEMIQWFEQNKRSIENFAKAKNVTLQDVTQPFVKSIQTINKDELKSWIKNISSNEKNLRRVARYLYYRSNVFFRIVNWYADMWDLNCRKVVPEYSLTKPNDETKFLKSYNDTLDILENMNLQGNMTEALINVYIEDVYYAITYYSEEGMFFYPIDPDECMIDSRYSTGDFGFAIDMSRWNNAKRKKLIEWIGHPLDTMLEEHLRTKQKYIHVPDEYAFVLKFRTDRRDVAIPPFLPLFLQLASLEDLIDIQADADALSIYKLIYLPMTVHNSSKDSDDFEYTPDLQHKYFNQMLSQGLIPEGVSAAMVPAEELKVIDFSKTIDSDTNSVEKSSTQILQTAGGGAVLNANGITSTAAFLAWLKSETEFALSSLMPQINGFANRFLSYKLSNPAHVEHFEVSVYTKDDFAKALLESAQYSFPNRLAYNTCLGIREKETMAMDFLENTILKLPEIMVHPLQSSYTQSADSGEVGQGAPTKDAGELTPEGDRSRNK